MMQKNQYLMPFDIANDWLYEQRSLLESCNLYESDMEKIIIETLPLLAQQQSYPIDVDRIIINRMFSISIDAVSVMFENPDLYKRLLASINCLLNDLRCFIPYSLIIGKHTGEIKVRGSTLMLLN